MAETLRQEGIVIRVYKNYVNGGYLNLMMPLSSRNAEQFRRNKFYCFFCNIISKFLPCSSVMHSLVPLQSTAINSPYSVQRLVFRKETVFSVRCELIYIYIYIYIYRWWKTDFAFFLLLFLWLLLTIRTSIFTLNFVCSTVSVHSVMFIFYFYG